MAELEIITTGRVSVDLYPEQIGVPLAEVTTFAKSLGGSATNVAVAAARLGRPSAVITKVGDDGFGPYIRAALEEFGVDPRWVGTDPELRTPLAFCEIHPPDDFPLLFYREPKAPDMNLTVEDLDFDAISAVPLFWITGTGLSDEPSRTATLAALEHRPSGITVFDLDYRPTLWGSEEEAAHCYREALRHATVAVGNQSEVEVAVGTDDPFEASEALLDLGLDLAIVKRGPEGVLSRTQDGVAEAPPIQVEVVNGLGAGDAFGGALCHALLSGWDAERTIRYANAAGAIVASRLACADDMPTREEVEQLLEKSSDA
ncbi:MAG TPA: 5-dehydro-2-deoxygluconokinase [Rubrobacter sp.]|nr:5-dehydro-2-deoxygluconokinase [Rubrobacteraceae bacterium]HEV8043843.1 5-dehydro-2-deoxygluconokinase [Rubrobacter sp.]